MITDLYPPHAKSLRNSRDYPGSNPVYQSVGEYPGSNPVQQSVGDNQAQTAEMQYNIIEEPTDGGSHPGSDHNVGLNMQADYPGCNPVHQSEINPGCDPVYKSVKRPRRDSEGEIIVHPYRSYRGLAALLAIVGMGVCDASGMAATAYSRTTRTTGSTGIGAVTIPCGSQGVGRMLLDDVYDYSAITSGVGLGVLFVDATVMTTPGYSISEIYNAMYIGQTNTNPMIAYLAVDLGGGKGFISVYNVCDQVDRSLLPSPLPTAAPTAIPTDAPTVAPTAIPTVSPTEGPTDSPVSAPTRSPTLFGRRLLCESLNSAMLNVTKVIEEIPYCFRFRLGLNGANGEATGKDDTKNGKKKANVKVMKVVKRTVRPKPKPKNTPTPKIQSSSMVDSKYLTALSDPWSERAVGARIPDPYGIESTTFHMRSTGKITAGSAGMFDMVFLGHPLYGYASSDCTKISTAAGNYPQNLVSFFKTLSNMESSMATYRTVSNGVKLKNLQGLTNITGTIVYARVPLTRSFFDPALLNTTANIGTATFAQVMSKLVGASFTDSSGKLTTSIIELPNARSITADELAKNELVLVNKPVSSSVQVFNAANQDSEADYGLMDIYDTVASTNAGNNIGSITASNGYNDNTESMQGWTAILVRGYGFPASTDIIGVDMVSHIEATPVLTESSSYVADGARKPNKNFGAFEATLSAIEKVPWARLVNVAKTIASSM